MNALEKRHKTALCSAVRTTRYSRKFITLLRDMSADLYKTDKGDLMQEMETVMEDELLNVFKDLLSEVDFNNSMEVEEVFKEVIDYIGEVEELSFIVPMHPSKDFLRRIYAWCSENINDEILLDFTTNRLMESGMIMVYKGHYFSYTLEDLLEEYFQEHSLERYFAGAEIDQRGTQNGE